MLYKKRILCKKRAFVCDFKMILSDAQSFLLKYNLDKLIEQKKKEICCLAL